MSEKEKRGRKKYLKGYTLNISGEYEYTGEYYYFDLPAGRLRRIKAAYVLFSAVTAAAFVCAGLLDHAGGRAAYVILPYAALLLPAALALADAIGFAASPGLMTRRQRDRAVTGLRRAAIACVILSAAAAAGEAAYMILHRGEYALAVEMVFVAACAAIAALNAFSLALQRTAAGSLRNKTGPHK